MFPRNRKFLTFHVNSEVAAAKYNSGKSVIRENVDTAGTIMKFSKTKRYF